MATFNPVLILTVIATYLSFASDAAKLPPEFERCARDDPKINECFRSAIHKAIAVMKNGIPSLQVLPVDPLAVTQIKIQDSPNRPVSISLDLTDVKLKGLTGATIRTTQADLNKRYVEANTLVPLLVLDSDYVMDGKFLVLPLKGNGKLTAKLHDAEVVLKIQAEPLTKNGNVHWNVIDFKVVVKTTTKFEVNFENLFDGNENLGKTTNEALNTGWRELWDALRPSFEESFSAVFLSIANQILSQVSEEDMFL